MFAEPEFWVAVAFFILMGVFIIPMVIVGACPGPPTWKPVTGINSTPLM